MASGSVLEIGIGSGLNIPFYDEAKIDKVIGLDPSEELNVMAKELAIQNNIDIEFIVDGAENISLKDNSIDTILITYTLCTIPLIEESTAEMKRVLNLDLTVGIGEGSMLVDGREIYTAKGLKVGLFQDTSSF